jgi:hypothetical protein
MTCDMYFHVLKWLKRIYLENTKCISSPELTKPGEVGEVLTLYQLKSPSLGNFPIKNFDLAYLVATSTSSHLL